jgi:hypothetical protein
VRYEADGLMNNAIPTADSFQGYFERIMGKGQTTFQSFNDVPNVSKPNFDHVEWMTYTAKIDTDVVPESPVGLSFANLCGRIGEFNLAIDSLFIIISRTGLVLGLPVNIPLWDALRTSHMVALYKCVGRHDKDISITFIGNLLKDGFALSIDLHEWLINFMFRKHYPLYWKCFRH